MSKQITYIPRQTSHGIHLFLTIITGGLWAVTGWPLFIALNSLSRGRKVVTKTVD